jgi:hypothetical protein
MVERVTYLALSGFWAALSLLMVVSPKRVFWLMAFGKFTVELESRWIANGYRVLGLMNLAGALIVMVQIAYPR